MYGHECISERNWFDLWMMCVCTRACVYAFDVIKERSSFVSWLDSEKTCNNGVFLLPLWNFFK